MSGSYSNLIEPFCVPDVYCTELAKAERIGPCVRLVFTVPQSSVYGDSNRTEQAVVAKLVIPATALQSIAELLISDISELRPMPESARVLS